MHVLCPLVPLLSTPSYGHFFFLSPGILDTAIVDRGKNVVSGSRDGTARLWDCGRSACLGVIADCGSSINGVAVGAADNSINLGSPEQMPSELRTVYEFVSLGSFSVCLSFSFSSSSSPLCRYFCFHHKTNIYCISTTFVLL